MPPDEPLEPLEPLRPPLPELELEPERDEPLPLRPLVWLLPSSGSVMSPSP